MYNVQLSDLSYIFTNMEISSSFLNKVTMDRVQVQLKID